MKNIKVYSKQNQLLSDKNLYEDSNVFINHIVSSNYFGKPKRWIRAKYNITSTVEGEEPIIKTIYPDGEYDEADVLETEEREIWTQTDPNEETDTAVMDKETWVKLKAEYYFDIEDYNPVPQSVSPMQIRLALNELGLRQTIENAVDSGSQDLKDMWKFASEFKRDYPLIEELSVSLGFTKEQVDNIFRFASTK